MSILNTNETPSKESPLNPIKELVKDVATGIAGLATGIGFVSGFGYLVLAEPDRRGQIEIENKRPDIGCKFLDLESANELRKFHLLDEKAVIEACGKAVKNYLEKGLTDAVVIQLPPRPSREDLLKEISKQRQDAQAHTPAP